MTLWSRFKFILCASLVVILSGCANIKLPLCPKIALSSYGRGVDVSPVNRMVADEIRREGLEMRQLSWFVAEFSGSSPSIRRLQENYPHMICAFDPVFHPPSAIRQDFLSCMAHAGDWIRIIQSPNPEELMATQTKFFENCAIGN